MNIHATKKSKHPVTRDPENSCRSFYRGVTLFKNENYPFEGRFSTSTQVNGKRLTSATRAMLLALIDTELANPIPF